MATKFPLYYICLLLVTFATHGGVGCKRSNSGPNIAPEKRDAPADVYMCGICGQPITITIVIRNIYQPPHFEFKVTVNNKPQRELIHFLEDASTMDPHFKFSAEHFGSLGYFITTINGLSGFTSNKTYWEIRESATANGASEYLELGVSSFVPDDTRNIIFNYTTWAQPQD